MSGFPTDPPPSRLSYSSPAETRPRWPGRYGRKAQRKVKKAIARAQTRHAAQRALRQESDEPQAGNRDRPVAGAARRRTRAAQAYARTRSKRADAEAASDTSPRSLRARHEARGRAATRDPAPRGARRPQAPAQGGETRDAGRRPALSSAAHAAPAPAQAGHGARGRSGADVRGTFLPRLSQAATARSP